MPADATPPDPNRRPSDESRAPEAREPEADQQVEGVDLERDAAPAATEVDDGEARVAEAGNAYVGRQMSDRLKANPRVEDGDEAVDEDPSTPEDD
ncbi:hypothetical protein [Rubrivirga litoralis]|uniref:Multidrug transporter n=1 Tax=Rubrivirga litoralis TaxID=3075598 RepID=A0ABU3BNS4_9BACT|nr:hypothetical protein [Rubrivirga sp. F394]MDT0630928.1 hypothetical protein [Rubrivirga sp. F394]